MASTNKFLLFIVILIVPFAWLVVLLAKLTGQNPKQIWKDIWHMSKKLEENKLISKVSVMLNKYVILPLLFIGVGVIFAITKLFTYDPIKVWKIESTPTIEEQEATNRIKLSKTYKELTGKEIEPKQITEHLTAQIEDYKNKKVELDLILTRIRGT